MFRSVALVAALSLPVAAVAAPTTSPTSYVAQAGASDLYEITSSRLVMTSRNPQVRDFAQQMVRDHTNSTAEVKAAARQAHFRPTPPHLNAMQARMVSQLRRASGPARDRLYIQQQRQAHQTALDLHRTFSQSGRSAPLRMTAGKITPVVRGHLDMLRGMRV